jgi:hypothetical protein
VTFYFSITAGLAYRLSGLGAKTQGGELVDPDFTADLSPWVNHTQRLIQDVWLVVNFDMHIHILLSLKEDTKCTL